MFGNDFAIDPITNQPISLMDSHYSVVRLYYSLLPGYQAEFQKAKDYYLNRTWHDYAVLLLQTAEATNSLVRPAGFRSAPVPPTAHVVALNKDYQLQIKEVPVCETPVDPDPAKQAIQKDPTIFTDGHEEWLIVNITRAGAGSGGAIVPPASNSNLTITAVVSFIKSLSTAERLDIISQVLQ